MKKNFVFVLSILWIVAAVPKLDVLQVEISLRRARSPSSIVVRGEELEFRNLYVIKNGALHDGFGNVILSKGKFIVNYKSGEITRIWGRKRVRTQWYSYLVDEEGNVWHGPDNLGKVEFVGDKGNLVFDGRTNKPLMIGGKLVRGSYEGVNLKRDSDTPLFDIMPPKEDVARLLQYTGPNRNPIGVVIDLDTDPPGDYIRFAETMAANPEITVLLPMLTIHRPGQSLFLRVDDIARTSLAAVLQAEWAIFGGQSAGKFMMRLKPYLAAMLGVGVDEIVGGTWDSGREPLMPNIRSEDLHETLVVGDVQGTYGLQQEEFAQGIIPDDTPVMIFRQTYISSPGELDMDKLFRPYEENYMGRDGNIQENLLLVFVDDTEDVNHRRQLREGIMTKARELGVSEKVFYFHRARDPVWRGMQEAYMRKVGRVLWLSYFLLTGENKGDMYTSARFDMRVRDSGGRLWLNSELYVDSYGVLNYQGEPVRR